MEEMTGETPLCTVIYRHWYAVLEQLYFIAVIKYYFSNFILDPLLSAMAQ